jgi:CBS domain-containing protein
MPATVSTKAAARLTLDADTAADLMTSNPISIRAEARVEDAITLLTDKGFSAAPVIDTAGRPVGVLSRADILAHDREAAARGTASDYYQRAQLALAEGEGKAGTVGEAGAFRVGDIMTPVVLSVRPDTPARRVVEDMVGYQVHRLFVVDDGGVLVGVISSLDVLKRLRPGQQ